MRFGKYLAELAAILAGLALAAVLGWYLLKGMEQKNYEKEGTLVQAFLTEPLIPGFEAGEWKRSAEGI